MTFVYKGKEIKNQRIDLIVEDDSDQAIVDLKSVSRLPDIATAQLLSYLKSTSLRRGLILNFGQEKLIDGIRRLSL
jgi:GxxExxY protein